MRVTLGFDYGLARVGVAVGNSLTGTARALPMLPPPRDKAGWDAVSRVVREWQPAEFIVGMPPQSAGNEALLSAIRRFALELQQRYALPVHWVDESLSSRSAAGELRDARAAGLKSNRVRPGDEDSLAAAALLQQFYTDGR
nr:Holliday junction resolvase RuvX [Oceanococcus sp. HetDA_MAG_MS8]